MYLTQGLHRLARQAPAALAAVDACEAIGWAALRDRVAAFAGALRSAGMRPGDRVAMLAVNSVDFVAYILGTWWAGGVINPVNTRWSVAEMAYSLRDCDTRFLFADTGFADVAARLRAEMGDALRVVVAAEGEGAIAGWSRGAAPVEDALRGGMDLAAILYTGGTTGRPKGVMLSHGNLAGSLLGVLSQSGGPAVGPYLNVAPLFHIAAISGLLITMFSGQASVLLPGFDPEAALGAIERHRVADLFLVPTMLGMLLRHPAFGRYDTSSVRQIRYGASPIDEALLDEVLAAFPDVRFGQSYGMTELSPVATMLLPEDHAPGAGDRLRSAGRATATCEVRIVDAEDREVPRGTVGEIVARGPGMTSGYWNLPDVTAEALRGGWMHTGDLGRMDDEGYVFVVDRLKDMIVTGGENVYSAEVESALSLSPDVAAVAVVAAPDPVWGERVHAVVVPRAGRTPDAATLIAHCREHIAGYKIPRSFDFVEALPLSAAGKVLKTALRDKLRGAN